MTITHDGTTSSYSMAPGQVWERFHHEFDPPLVWRDGRDGWVIDIRVVNGGGQWHHMDNVAIDFDSDMTA
jgi:hypothetical protein